MMTIGLSVRQIIGFIFLFLSGLAICQTENDKPIAEFKTNLGDFQIELNEKEAPATVHNFMRYINEGFYDNKIFHRVIKDYIIQTGAYNIKLESQATHSPIESESQNQLKNRRATVAMARSNLPHSATSQFFINLVDNNYLDAGNIDAHGYAVFGKVIQGMNVIDQIATTPVTTKNAFKYLPKTPIIIKSATIIYDPETKETDSKSADNQH